MESKVILEWVKQSPKFFETVDLSEGKIPAVRALMKLLPISGVTAKEVIDNWPQGTWHLLDETAIPLPKYGQWELYELEGNIAIDLPSSNDFTKVVLQWVVDFLKKHPNCMLQHEKPELSSKPNKIW